MLSGSSGGERARSAAEDGARLAAEERRLCLFLAHLAGRALRGRVELEDLAQEVFVRALASPRGLPPSELGERALWNLLAHLARQVVIDAARALRAARRDGREQRFSRTDWSRAGPATGAPGPHSAAAARETRNALAAAFLALAPEHQRVLGLRQFEGLSAEEAGRRMGRSAAAVHSLYRRALEAWQHELERKRISRDESAPFLRPGEP
jgi:RNA polymerase sigma factor (sigma-70 family)